MIDPEVSTMAARLLHLIFLSTFWGMQIWYTFFSSFVMGSLNKHMYGYIHSQLLPIYLNIGSVCAFFNLIIFTMYHPHNELGEKEAFQMLILFVCVMIAALNSHYFGAMTSEIMADMHRIEQFCCLRNNICLSSTSEVYEKLCKTDSEYRKLGCQLWWYHWLSSLCNLCCIICNGFSFFYLTQHLHIL